MQTLVLGIFLALTATPQTMDLRPYGFCQKPDETCIATLDALFQQTPAESPLFSPMLYLRATIRNNLGMPEGASADFQEAGKAGVLAPVANLKAAGLLVSAKQTDAALSLLLGIGEQSPWYPAAKKLHGSVLCKQGKAEEGAELLFEAYLVAAGTPSGDATLAAIKTGCKGALEFTAAKALAISEPACTKVSASSPRVEKALDFIAKGGHLKGKQKDIIKKIDNLSIIKKKKIDEPLKNYLLGEYYLKKVKNFAKAKSLLLQAKKAKPDDPALKIAIALAYAECLERLDAREQAIPVLDEVIASHPDGCDTPKLLFMVGSSQASMGNFGEAEAIMEELLALHPESDVAAEALFFLGWRAYLKGEYVEALLRFGDLDDTYGSVTFGGVHTREEQALYWMARIHQKMGDTAKAVEILTFIVQKYPLDYYSLLALRRLEDLVQDVDIAGLAVPYAVQQKGTASGSPLGDVVLTLFSPPGETDSAAAELVKLLLLDDAEALLKTMDDQGSLSPLGNDLLVALDLAKGGKTFYRQFKKRRIHGLFYPTGLTVEAWKAAYPIELVEEAGDALSDSTVDPFLLLALIRYESHFTSYAVSPKGAVGLCQLLPSTATWFADHIMKLDKKIGLKDLYKPKENMQIGAAYLEYLVGQYMGDLALGLVAYHGGPLYVDTLIQENPGLDAEELFETMSRESSRDYVLRIVHRYGVYSYIYRDEDDIACKIPSLNGTLPPCPESGDLIIEPDVGK